MGRSRKFWPNQRIRAILISVNSIYSEPEFDADFTCIYILKCKKNCKSLFTPVFLAFQWMSFAQTLLFFLERGGWAVWGRAVVKWIGADEYLSFVSDKDEEEMKNG